MKLKGIVDSFKNCAKWTALAVALFGVGYCSNQYEREKVEKANSKKIAMMSIIAGVSQSKDSNGGSIEIRENTDYGGLETNIQTEHAPAPAVSNADAVEQNQNYASFRYQDELEDIFKHSKRIGVEPELLMAIRSAENGADDIAYGIIPQGSAKGKYDSDMGYFGSDGNVVPYKSNKEKQLCWAAWTVKKNRDRGRVSIEALAEVYCPVGAENDPNGLNRNWKSNVERFYNQFKGKQGN